jgi:hypothetical protein
MPRLEVRLTDEQMERLRSDAEAAGMNVSDWIRYCCLEKAGGGREAAHRGINESRPIQREDFDEMREDVTRADDRARRRGCAICGKTAGQLHAKSCDLGGTVTA